MENLFDACQVRQLQDYLAAAGIEWTFVSYLWGHESMKFTGDDPNYQVEVFKDVTQISPAEFEGLILPGGYAMDRLRYQASPICGAPNQAPAVQFLRSAVALMNEGQLKIGVIGHGLMLFTASPDTLQGRQVTCAHNIIGEVANAGGFVMFNGDQTADLHLDRGLLTARDSSVAQQFFRTFVEEVESVVRRQSAE